MTNKLTQAQDVFLDKINQICSKLGLNNIMAQLYSLLYLSGKTMSLDDMVERLKISKGSVSINIRALENYGAVRRVWVKGSRRDFYEAESDIYKVIMERVRSLLRDRLSEADEMIDLSNNSLIAANIGADNLRDSEAIVVFEQRLAELRILKDKMKSLFDLFNSGVLDNILIAQESEKHASKDSELIAQ